MASPTSTGTASTHNAPTAPTSTPTSNAPVVPTSTPTSSAPATPVSSSNGSITIAPTSFSAVATQGQGNPAPTPITITNTENRDLLWQTSSSSNWLNLNSSAGNIASDQSISLAVSYSSAGLVPGSYHAQIQIAVRDTTSAHTLITSQNIQITLTITQPCSLQISPTNLTFKAVLLQKNIQAQNIMLTESGNCNYPLTWKANVDAASSNWLMLASSEGTDAGTGSTLTVNVKTQNSVLGTYHGQITFSAIDNSGMNVNVTTTVTINFTVLASL
ncbi:MAG TPA: hypothetical protein VGN34_00420 [Ktedonobacteraceae bacterium]